MAEWQRQVASAVLASVVSLAGCSDEQAAPAASNPAAPSGSATEASAASAPAAAKRPASAGTTAGAEAPDSRTPEGLVAAGRSVYASNCIACHNMNPTRDGALGPAVSGASLELLRARIVHGEYPPGYEPKRPSKIMVPLPHLEPKLPELAAYLGSLGE